MEKRLAEQLPLIDAALRDALPLLHAVFLHAACSLDQRAHYPLLKCVPARTVRDCARGVGGCVGVGVVRGAARGDARLPPSPRSLMFLLFLLVVFLLFVFLLSFPSPSPRRSLSLVGPRPWLACVPGVPLSLPPLPPSSLAGFRGFLSAGVVFGGLRCAPCGSLRSRLIVARKWKSAAWGGHS